MRNKLLALFLPIIMCLSISFVSMAKEEETYLSDEVQEICIKYGEEYSICPELIMAIIERESSGKYDAVNGDCKGLMQVSEKWNKHRMKVLKVSNIFDADGNIHVGTDYLSELFEKYEDAATVLMVWHGESNAVKKSERGEISKYAKGILERSTVLERLHGK